MSLSEQKPCKSTYNKAAKGSKPKPPPPLSVRFSLEEHQVLKRKAGKLPISTYVRRAALGEDICKRDMRPARRRHQASADHEMIGRALGELGSARLGQNFSCIANALRNGVIEVSPETEAELKDACAAVFEMRDALISALGVKVL